MRKLLLLFVLFIFCFKIGYNQPGSLDSSFGGKGWIEEGFIKTNLDYENIIKILPEKNNSFIAVIAGFNSWQGALSRFLADGTLDKSFAGNGYLVLPKMSIENAALQRDEKILVAETSDPDSYDYSLARYSAGGSADNTFSGDGMLTVGFKITSIVAQSDGKILVGGESQQLNNPFVITRYNPDGSPDVSFGKNGKLVQDFVKDRVIAMGVQSDGKIVANSSVYVPPTNPDYGDGYIQRIIIRFKNNGDIDSGFAENGKINVPDGLFLIQGDDKIVIVTSGSTDSSTTVFPVRFNRNGSQDTVFNTNAKQGIYLDKQSYPTSAAFQSDGKIVVSTLLGGTNGNSKDFSILCYNEDGSVDTGFGKYGKLTTDFGSNDFAACVSVQKDGKIVAGGGTTNGRVIHDYAIARYDANGSPDKTFFSNGKETGFIPRSYGYLTGIGLQSDGKIVVSGTVWDSLFRYNFFISRYNANGKPDDTFGKGGKQITDFGYDYSINESSVAIQKDGKTVIAGFVFKESSNPNDDKAYFAVARYNTDGSPDSTFSGDGKEVTDFGTKYLQSSASAVLIQEDGKIVVGGSVSDTTYSIDFAVARYNSDGSPDKTFGNNGIQITDLGSSYDAAYSMAIQSDGKIVLAGRSDNGHNLDFAVVRYNSDGSLDKTFSDDGKQTTDFAADNDYGAGVAIQNGGKIVLCGSTLTDYGKNESFAIVRYNTDGSPDTSFNGSGKQIIDFGSTSHADNINLQSDGKLVISGLFDKQKNFNYNIAIARLTINGLPDSTFNSNGKVTSDFGLRERAHAAVIYNNKLYVSGNYVVAVYNLTDKNNTAPTVTLTTPADNATYLAPAAHIKLEATASESGGTITKVEFYKDSTLLHTETVAPYGYVWRKVPLGNYTITAKAYDNSGNVTTSAPVQISVVLNKSPVVSITKPGNNQTYAAPAYIHLEAAASDTDGRVTIVKFYNGTTLLDIQYKLPYTFSWKNVPAGTYTITAVATDNWGAQTTSAPLTISVTNTAIVSNKPNAENEKTTLNDTFGLRLSPNPATNIVNIYTSELKPNKPVTLSIISVSGIVLKTIRISNASTQLNVSSLASGVYTIKMISGDKVLYKQFVKL